MANTVFFSWQADRPTKGGRNLVERALERAIEKIGDDTALEEAVRDLEVDRDTKGVPGSPPIVETIFAKIDKATVFVPDLTFVGLRPDGRPTPNPNVLIEYGWALKSLGHRKIVPLMNTAFGEPTPEAMPFDMRHLRNPIQYACPSDADEDARRLIRDRLAKDLERSIRDVLHSENARQEQSRDNARADFTPRTSSLGQGRFRNADEPLGIAENLSSGSGEVKLADEPAIWLRLMPVKIPNRTWQISELRKSALQDDILRPFVQDWSGLDYLRGSDGFGLYAPLNDSRDTTHSVVFAFKTGEVWSVDTYMLNAMRRGGTNAVPTAEKDFSAGIANYSNFLLRLGAEPPFKWIAGMENLSGRGIIDPRGHMAGFRGPSGRCLEDLVVEEGFHYPNEQPEKSIEPFWIRLFDSCGLERTPLLST